jgi:acyl-CoA synthetase (AMP-forming)/AMP-acid ligase II
MTTIELVCSLVFFDGLASEILLLPSEEDALSRKWRLEQAKFDHVIEGEGLSLTRLLGDLSSRESFSRPASIETTWLLPTSGTTGIPKLIPHTLASLTRSMSARQLGDSYIWGSLYSLRRFAGLQVFLQAWLSATPLVLSEDNSDSVGTISDFIVHGCNALSATPSMWRKLAMSPSFDKLSLKQITLGGEIVDQSILDILSKKFPGARITHIYASTEAGVGFVVKDKCEGFPVEYLTEPPGGLALRIDDSGHLWINPSTQCKDSEENISGWIDSGDIVAVNGPRVKFLGRANGSINVGGNKVMPEEVENVIKELSEVAFVQVRAKKSAMLGNLVEAAVSLNPDYVFDPAFKKKVIAHCRSKLDGFKVPAFIVEAENIQLTTSGKILRKNE